MLLNPYTLCGTNTAGMIDRTYVRLVQRFPEGVGFIYQLGIPVQKSFCDPITCFKAKAILGLENDMDYLLVSGGSMGRGNFLLL